jgi:hypothetical protein
VIGAKLSGKGRKESVEMTTKGRECGEEVKQKQM